MSALTDRIHAAVASGDFSAAGRLFDEHAKALCDRARAGILSAEEAREAGELVEWTRQTALAARRHLEARAQDARNGLYVIGAYRR